MMSFFGPAAHVGYVLPGLQGTGLESVLAVLSVGVFAMGLSDIASSLADRLADGDDGSDGSAESDDPFGGDPADDLGGGEFGEEAFDGGDGLGDFDEWEDDGGDGLEGAGGGASDLEPRIDELEDEVASISSTVSTVRSENQAINESVEDIEDNIRQLLDIYEMVTRGVNPFVDDVAGGGADGSFGLFDDGDDEGFDDLDPDVAEADPDSFFDDDFAGGDETEDSDPFEDEGSLGEEDPLVDAADDLSEQSGEESADEPDSSADGGGDGGGGKTFEELKSEYESGDAEWQSGEGAQDAEDAGSPERAPDPASDSEPEDEPADDGSEADEGSGASAETSAPESTASTDGGADTEGKDSADADGKPYLEALPDGYATELLVIEWLSYLRSRSNTSEALRAIRYYETIDWIGSPAAAALKEYLTGLADGTPDASAGEGTLLTIDHHTHSLRYIGRLGGADVEVERLDWPSPTRGETRLERGEQRGIQR